MEENDERRSEENQCKIYPKCCYFKDTEFLWKDKNTPLALYSIPEIFAADEALDEILTIRENFFKKLEELRSKNK